MTKLLEQAKKPTTVSKDSSYEARMPISNISVS